MNIEETFEYEVLEAYHVSIGSEDPTDLIAGLVADHGSIEDVFAVYPTVYLTDAPAQRKFAEVLAKMEGAR